MPSRKDMPRIEETMGYYTRDANGGRALRGLTATETEELERMWLNKSTRRDIDTERFLKLSNQHEAARMQR
jgi:hypothetical protein